MKGVTFDVTIPRFLLAKSVGRVSESVLFGGLSGVRYTEVTEPGLPGAGWVKIDVISCGICGSDLGNISYSASPSMEPFGSFPAVLGHEVLGRVREVGSDVHHVQPGQRVTVDPMISCAARGYADACPSCSSGLHSTCERAGEEAPVEVDGKPLGAGLTIGYHGDLPGGWGETMIAHGSQVFPVSDALNDNTAVLMEPFSIALHAVLQTPPHPDEPVLVIGSGTIALATIWALRATGFSGYLLGQAKRPHEQALLDQVGLYDLFDGVALF